MGGLWCCVPNDKRTHATDAEFLDDKKVSRNEKQPLYELPPPYTFLSSDYPIKPVPFTSVRLTDKFWAPRIETNRAVTIPFAFEQCIASKRVLNFEAAAAALKGQPWLDYEYTEYPFDDTDIYKVIEGASFSLSARPDPDLSLYLDLLIEKIAAAQEADGYLYTARTFNPEHPQRAAGPERWSLERVGSHELYNFGHLYDAAVAHYQATGKRSLLDIALRTVDLLEATFGPGKQSIFPGHQIIEMGLVRLFRITGQSRCLKLAKFFLDSRHPDGHDGAREYNQAHVPVVKQRTAVGHAVRAGYMYAGMADVAALTTEKSFKKAIDRIWNDVVSSKLYITGGIGARDDGEAFGDAFELPNATAYAETCASIANVYWNHRQFLLTGDSKYIDILELTLYNALLAGISLDGKGFFYPNPLESFGDYERQPWFGCACCPGNMTRFLASVSGYQYAQRGSEIYVNLYAGGTANLALDDGTRIRIKQDSKYPWYGHADLTIEDITCPAVFTIRLRVPGWACGQLVASSLYSKISPMNANEIKAGSTSAYTVSVNGEAFNATVICGYISFTRLWSVGDVVSLAFQMDPVRIRADLRVEDNVGRYAIMRGPLVYCFESLDNPDDFDLHTAAVPVSKPISVVWDSELFGGVVKLKIGGLTAIPYYSWANRGKSHMVTWIRE
ncbi:hypothetical protein BJ742DRAFT_197237 [Cladochytrium replicatum]|nr:hypothetical protein BJ742DRAFT_197237 [Cladochytrium replicatum]